MLLGAALVGLLVVGAVIGGASDDETEDVQTSATTAAPLVTEPATSAAPTTAGLSREERRRRADSRLACDHFRNIVRDTTQGILTDAELRKKLKEVNDDAIIGTAQVQASATAMLAAVTQGDVEGFETAATAMSDACREAGR